MSTMGRGEFGSLHVSVRRRELAIVIAYAVATATLHLTSSRISDFDTLLHHYYHKHITILYILDVDAGKTATDAPADAHQVKETSREGARTHPRTHHDGSAHEAAPEGPAVSDARL